MNKDASILLCINLKSHNFFYAILWYHNKRKKEYLKEQITSLLLNKTLSLLHEAREDSLLEDFKALF